MFQENDTRLEPGTEENSVAAPGSTSAGPNGITAPTDGPNSRPTLAPPSEAETYERVVSEFMPCGIIEETWCRDIARNIHHAHRLRVLREGFLRVAKKKLIFETLKEALAIEDRISREESESQEALNLSGILYLGREVAEANGLSSTYSTAVQKLLSLGLEIRDMSGRAYVENMSKIEAIEKLIVVTDSRRDILIREFERRRERGRSNVPPAELRHVGASTG